MQFVGYSYVETHNIDLLSDVRLFCFFFFCFLFFFFLFVLFFLFFFFSFFFFFFKAEDGIRDVAVTGVQTCALPIWELLIHCSG